MPYLPDIQAAARAGTLLPTDYTNLNPSFAYLPGGVISTANDLAIWIEALVTGRLFDAAYQRRWLDSLQAKYPSMPNGQHDGTAWSDCAGARMRYTPRRRDSRLQFAHGLRPQQPGDVCDVD